MLSFKKHSRFVALFLLALVFIVGSGTGCRQREKQASPPEKITIAYTESTGMALVHIAIAKGFFTEEGLDVTSQPYITGKPAMDAVIEGKADLATTSDTVFMFAAMENKKITAIAVIAVSNKNAAILARKDRGISKLSDLKGKRIGVVRGGISDYFAGVFLTVSGVDGKEVRIIDLKAEELAAALTTGRVDAVSIWQPALLKLQKELGNKGHTFYGETFFSSAICMSGLQDFVTEHPGAVRKFLRALIKAETFAKQYPEESRRLMAGLIKTDEAILGEIWDSYDYQVGLNQAFIVDLEDQTRWALKNRFTTRRDMPNYLEFISVDGLRAVKPEAVRIIR
jgi:ABC-type nitrate/sulfonate/bicarbonate transport system substrate-binding protein